MSEKIFREKSLDRISSPEQLDDYLKVSTPSLWLVLSAVIILLVGIIVWANVENLETTINAAATVDQGVAEIVLTGNDAEIIKEGMKVRINNYETEVEFVQYDDLGRAIAICVADVPTGNYRVQVVTESIHPISFLFK
ncbi:MAG: hypothetical protein J6S38_08020 [Erysipelotrichaceae bacterium]|nr:hypothetical protein [Erysipelotrichaceae bacterium]MBP5280003.1 hypothetical protein [Erysipelotrichaceae bacterium]